MLKNVTLNKKLALLVILVAILAMSLSVISPNGWNAVNEKPNFISVLDLAERIKERDKIILLDLRPQVKYDSFHLPSAELFLDKKQLVNQSNKYVFYSDDYKSSMKIWSTLTSKTKEKSYILYGGVHDWYEKLLYPKIPIHISEQDASLAAKIILLNKFFGGRIEISEKHHLLDYYYLDMKKVKTHSSRQGESLVRKGC
jgi:rhodanese-related sulfurtransferase